MMRRLTAVFVSGVLFGAPVWAQDITTSAEAFSLALGETGLADSETVRIQSIDSALFRNGSVDWEFKLRDGETLYDIDVAQDGSVEVETESDPDAAAPDFWAQLPTPDLLETVEDYVALARSALVEDDATLVPRDQYIVSYEVCDPPAPDQEAKGENGCRRDQPMQEWSVVLRADIDGTDQWKNRLVAFEDGALAGISGVRVGGNW